MSCEYTHRNPVVTCRATGKRGRLVGARFVYEFSDSEEEEKEKEDEKRPRSTPAAFAFTTEQHVHTAECEHVIECEEEEEEEEKPKKKKKPKKKGITWHECDQPGCDYKVKKAWDLKQHLANKHDIGVTWHECDQPGCDYKSKQAGTLNRHLADKHDVGVKWHKCQYSGCDFKSKRADILKQHLAFKHDVGVKWCECEYPDCDFKSKQVGNLKQHLADTHDVGVTWHKCQYPDCGYKAKQASSLKTHLSFKHDVGVKWHKCQYPDCDFKAKQAGHLKTHLADKHDVGVTWHNCEYPDCGYKAKHAGYLMDHKKAMHWKLYCAIRKKQEERVCKALLAAGWKQYFGGDTLPPPGYFKREHGIDFECVTPLVNGTAPLPPRGRRPKKKLKKVKDQDDTPAYSCRIDFILAYAGEGGVGYVYLEVDEHQHRFGYRQADGAAISCDAKRVANVHTSLTIECAGTSAGVPSIYWLRYNPHEWHVDGQTIRLSKVDREARLCAFLERYEPVVPMAMGYAFFDYDQDGGLDVLTADEFPEVFVECTYNLEGLDDGISAFGRE